MPLSPGNEVETTEFKRLHLALVHSPTEEQSLGQGGQPQISPSRPVIKQMVEEGGIAK